MSSSLIDSLQIEQIFRLALYIPVLSGLFWLCCVRRLDGTSQIAVTASFIVHATIATIIYRFNGVVTNDAGTYYQQASSSFMYFSGLLSSPPDLAAGKEGWPTILGAIFYLVGPSPLVGLWLNSALACGAIAILVRRIAIDFGSNSKVRLTPFLILAMPMFWLWSVPMLREPSVWFSLAAISLGLSLVKSQEANTARTALSSISVVVVATSFLIWTRTSFGLAVLVCIGVAVLVSRRSAVTSKIAIVVALLAATPFGIGYFASSQFLDEDKIAMSQEELSRASSGFESGTVGNLPLNFARVVFGPFPWELPGLSPVYVLDLLPWLLALLIAAKPMYREWRRFPFELMAFFSLVVALAWTSGNYGTMIRLRFAAIIMLVVFVASALETRSPVRLAKKARGREQ